MHIMDSLRRLKRAGGLGVLALAILAVAAGLLLIVGALAGIIPPSTGAASPVNDGQRPSVRTITPSTQAAMALGATLPRFINGVMPPSTSTITPSSQNILPTSATVSPEVETATTSTESIFPSEYDATPIVIGLPATISQEPVVPHDPYSVTPKVAGEPATVAPEPVERDDPYSVPPKVAGLSATISPPQTVDSSTTGAEGSSSTGSSPSSSTVTPSTMAAPPASQEMTPYENGVMTRSQYQEPVSHTQPPFSAHAPLFMNYVVPVQAPAVVRIGSGTCAPGGDCTVALEAVGVPPPGLGEFTINIVYDQSVEPVGWNADGSPMDTVQCTLDYAPYTIRCTGTSASGVAGDMLLANLIFVCPNLSPGECALLHVSVVTFADPDGYDIPYNTVHGEICREIWICGDVNCDSTVNAVDAMFILQYVIGSRLASDQCPPPEDHLYLPAGDVDCDDDVDAVDALFVLQHVVGLRPELCPGP